jgi:hypothetical protein
MTVTVAAITIAAVTRITLVAIARGIVPVGRLVIACLGLD